MNNLVDFNKYTKKRDKREMFTEIIEEVKREGQNGHVFSLSEAAEVAKKILNKAVYYHEASTPINRIAEDFGIFTYKTSLSSQNISGVIYVGGTTRKIYNSDKVILVESSDPHKHQRFVIAHEIAHYLFDCLSKPQYNDGKLLFAETYPKKDHNSPKEFRADRFAAELLMPTDLFIRQYNYAMDEKNNRIFTVMYLSEFFQTKVSSIEKRISEVLQ